MFNFYEEILKHRKEFLNSRVHALIAVHQMIGVAPRHRILCRISEVTNKRLMQNCNMPSGSLRRTYIFRDEQDGDGTVQDFWTRTYPAHQRPVDREHFFFLNPLHSRPR